MWIYLWHIIVIKIYEIYNVPEYWVLKLVLVYSISVFAVWLMNNILDIIEIYKKCKIFKYLRG